MNSSLDLSGWKRCDRMEPGTFKFLAGLLKVGEGWMFPFLSMTKDYPPAIEVSMGEMLNDGIAFVQQLAGDQRVNHIQIWTFTTEDREYQMFVVGVLEQGPETIHFASPDGAIFVKNGKICGRWDEKGNYTVCNPEPADELIIWIMENCV